VPGDVRGYPHAIAQALSLLRQAGFNRPYSVVLGAKAYTKLAASSDNGYPILQHIKRLVEAPIVWAPPRLQRDMILTKITDGGLLRSHPNPCVQRRGEISRNFAGSSVAAKRQARRKPK
jgi:hypothetical protein